MKLFFLLQEVIHHNASGVDKVLELFISSFSGSLYVFSFLGQYKDMCIDPKVSFQNGKDAFRLKPD